MPLLMHHRPARLRQATAAGSRDPGAPKAAAGVAKAPCEDTSLSAARLAVCQTCWRRAACEWWGRGVSACSRRNRMKLLISVCPLGRWADVDQAWLMRAAVRPGSPQAGAAEKTKALGTRD